MSFKCDSVWPIRLDLSPLECRQILREKELLCYSDVVSVLRAQGPLSEEKKSVLKNLQKIFSISDDRNKAELRRAANNEKLTTISEIVSGFDAYAEWASLGAQKMPPTKRPTPRTVFCDEASQTVSKKYEEENAFPPPNNTNDVEYSVKIEEAITRNRSMKSAPCSISTSTVAVNTESTKPTPKKEGLTSFEYNLHLLSEIATGESTQSGSAVETSDIKPDLFSIQNQIDDIELPLPITEQLPINQIRYSSNSHASMTPVPTNVVLQTNDSNTANISGNSPLLVGNNVSGQRYVLPRSAMSQGINLVPTNTQRHQATNFIGQQQQQISNQPTTYLNLNNNQMRSPPSHQLGTNWAGQQQSQQLYIQNVSSHHGLGIQHNLGHQTMENLTSLGYTLQQRAVRAEQHQTSSKQNLIVRNLGSQPTVEADRNKRYMVVKGNSGANNMGPSNKKPKISNPSNRQPGRPPLMPAPSSAYTSRPYVANEIFHTNRTSTSSTSAISDSVLSDSNGLKISSVISSGNNINNINNSTANNRGGSGNSSQVRSNSYYSVSRGNGVQRNNFDSNTVPVVQLGTGNILRTMDNPNAGNSSNTLRPKNIQPIISVVPLSPRGQSMSDSNTTSNISILNSSVKEENLEYHNETKDPVLPVKVINKSEMYANLLDRINSPARLSLNQTENKTQKHNFNISDIS